MHQRSANPPARTRHAVHNRSVRRRSGAETRSSTERGSKAEPHQPAPEEPAVFPANERPSGIARSRLRKPDGDNASHERELKHDKRAVDPRKPHRKRVERLSRLRERQRSERARDTARKRRAHERRRQKGALPQHDRRHALQQHARVGGSEQARDDTHGAQGANARQRHVHAFEHRKRHERTRSKQARNECPRAHRESRKAWVRDEREKTIGPPYIAQQAQHARAQQHESERPGARVEIARQAERAP